MPYKRDGSDAPPNIQKLPANARRKWVAVWNAAYARCQDKHGADCEGTAFRIANAGLRRKPGRTTA